MRVIQELRYLFMNLIDAVVPPRATERCVQALTVEILNDIIRRSKDPIYAAPIHTILPYRNRAVKALIYELKYRQNPHAAWLAATLIHQELLGMSEEQLGTPLLIPTPMHANRRRMRGYNQTELLCTHIIATPDLLVTYAPRALMRIRAGTPQQKLSRTGRLANMHGAMRADPRTVRGRTCIVIDDVSTTGATLMECRRALLEAGAKAVCLLALAG